MAIFGSGSSATTHADDAVTAGCAMLCRLELLNVDLVRGNEAPLHIGIGINTGRAIVGSIGSSERMEFTVTGNTVNVASRLEGLNKKLSTSLLLSKATKDHLTRLFSLRALPPRQVKGVDELVEIFTVELQRSRHLARAVHRTVRGAIGVNRPYLCKTLARKWSR